MIHQQELMESLIPLHFIQLSGILKGRTRIQKLVFLLEMNSKVPVDYEFKKGDYGPFSFKLYKTISNLVSLGLLIEKHGTTPSGRPVVYYKLTKPGSSLLKTGYRQKILSKKIRVDMDKIYQKYGDLPMVTLIKEVYDRYPKWAEESIFEFR